MTSIKLARLPDRTPVKMTIQVSPDLARSLREYSDFYVEHYGSPEQLSELIPAMLEAFLDDDRAFRRSQRAKPASSG